MATSARRQCIFCDIIHGAAEVSICYEDAMAIAFMDIQPVNPGHLLVVPREHYESLEDLPRELGRHLHDVALRLAYTVKKTTGCPGMNIVVNSGAAAGQDVFHFHVHVIPRAPDDGFDIPLPFPGSSMPERERLDAMAARIVTQARNPVASR